MRPVVRTLARLSLLLVVATSAAGATGTAKADGPTHRNRRTAQRAPQAAAATKKAQALARRLGLGSVALARELLAGKVSRKVKMAAGGDRLPGTLQFPVTRGWFVRGFGSGDAGYHLAVDIGGKHGSNVRSVAPGIVAYSGNEVRGYGNIVVVVHSGGLVSMYAHNSKLLVSPGMRVTKGQILAELGSTGISRGPHVHFELMHDGKNCDPLPLFRPGVRKKNGRPIRVTASSWSRPNRRPAAVQCEKRRRYPNSRWVESESDEPEEHTRHVPTAAPEQDGNVDAVLEHDDAVADDPTVAP